MKEKILEISEKLKNGEINENTAKEEFSFLFKNTITREEIYKQSYLVMSNINAVKLLTNIKDEQHDTLMKSFFTLQGLFNDFLKQNGIE